MVEILEDIKGYSKLSGRYKTVFIFKLKEYLDSYTKEEIENSDIISVKRIKKDKAFELNVIKSGKADIVYLQYGKIKK